MMNDILARKLSGATGLLGFEHFQNAYVTNDLARAVEIFRESYGITAFTIFDTALPAPATMRVALVWNGGVMIELIEATGPGTEMYTERLPDSFAIKHHHFGYLIESEAQWASLERFILAEGKTIALRYEGEMFRVVYVDAPELGHYLEFIMPTLAGRDFFNDVESSASVAA